MKKFKLPLLIGLALAAVYLAAAAVFFAGGETNKAAAADVPFGSAAVTEDKTYTLPEMLTYAIQDEYLAYEEYGVILESFGTRQPFFSIQRAEAAHISALEPLFEQYGAVLPENNAGAHTVAPESLSAALYAGVLAEEQNIAMYEAFLQQDLPDDVRAVFTALKNASMHHLAVFETTSARLDGDSASEPGQPGMRGFARNR